eukprot:16429311-Heterocapsa_arctica.AAC.1
MASRFSSLLSARGAFCPALTRFGSCAALLVSALSALFTCCPPGSSRSRPACPALRSCTMVRSSSSASSLSFVAAASPSRSSSGTPGRAAAAPGFGRVTAAAFLHRHLAVLPCRCARCRRPVPGLQFSARPAAARAVPLRRS